MWVVVKNQIFIVFAILLGRFMLMCSVDWSLSLEEKDVLEALKVLWGACGSFKS